MVADALATAAMVLSPAEGLALIEEQGAEGIVITPTLDRLVTAGPFHERSRPVTVGVPVDQIRAVA
jgi:thiamine biosynthesis lipoprotein ApbE